MVPMYLPDSPLYYLVKEEPENIGVEFDWRQTIVIKGQIQNQSSRQSRVPPLRKVRVRSSAAEQLRRQKSAA